MGRWLIVPSWLQPSPDCDVLDKKRLLMIGRQDDSACRDMPRHGCPIGKGVILIYLPAQQGKKF